MNINKRRVVESFFEIGFYPGILFGVRNYSGLLHSNIVLYIPLVDFSWTTIYEYEE